MVLGIIKTKSKFCCHFDETPNGYEVQVYADLGTHLDGHVTLTAVKGDLDSVLFRETVVVRVRDGYCVPQSIVTVVTLSLRDSSFPSITFPLLPKCPTKVFQAA